MNIEDLAKSISYQLEVQTNDIDQYQENGPILVRKKIPA